MGGSSARITAADFLTPPELAPWKLAANGAARIGGVRLALAADASGTCLQDCYQQVPLRILPPFRFGPDRPALLYLLNPTAGLMDGDGQLIEVVATEHTRALVTGQSATRIHPATHGFCTQRWAVRVERGAVLVILPGPAIPFAGCRYYQHVDIDLAAGAGLVWGDIWLAGRYARGGVSEQFQFEVLVQQLTVRREGRLIFRDRFSWRGPWDRGTAAWHFGSAMACGSLFITGSIVEAPAGSENSVSQATLPTAAQDSCVRCHGPAEAVISWVVQTALRTAGRLAGDAAALPWLAPWLDLGPNHWFSPAPASRQNHRTG